MDLRRGWADPERRPEIIASVRERGIDFAELREAAGQPEADPFDLLCHVAFNAPLRTRRERAQRLRSERKDFCERYGDGARQVLEELVEKYAEHGDAQFALPEVLKVPPISEHGQVSDIISLFGGAAQLRAAVTDSKAPPLSKRMHRRPRRRRRLAACSSPPAISCARTRA